MDRSHCAALSAVALLVLAGWAGILAGSAAADRGDGPDEGPTAQQPPSAQDDGQVNETTDGDGETAVGGDDLPPGVTQSGVSNASALVAAHQNALTDTGYRFVLETNLSSGFAGGVEQWAVQNGSVEAGLSPFRFQTVSRLVFENESASPPPSVTEAWGNDTTVAVRTQSGNATQVQRVERGFGGELRIGGRGTGPDRDGPVGLTALLTQSTVIETVLRSGEFEVADVREEAGTSLVTLRATEVNRSAFGTDRTVSTFDASLVVDEEGVVRRLDYELAFERGEGPAIRYEYRLTDLGTVAVEEPPWVSEAFESTQTDDSTGVVVSGSMLRPIG